MNIRNLFRFCGQQSNASKSRVAQEKLAAHDKRKSDTRWGRHLKSVRTFSEKPKACVCIKRVKKLGQTISQYFRRVYAGTAAKYPQSQQQASAVTLFRTAQALATLQERYLCAAVYAFTTLERDPTPLLEKMNQCKQRLQLSDNRPLTRRDLQEAQTFKPMLINELKYEFVKLGFSEHEAKRQAKQAFAGGLREVLGTQKWQTVYTHFQHNGLRYECTLVPAAQMKRGAQPLFRLPHEGGGVPSCATNESAHATNLWTTELHTPDNKGRAMLLFKGVRHGILSPFGLAAHSDARFDGARNRALNVVAAALYARPDLMRDAEQGKAVSLKLASTSLVTGGYGGEDEMLNDQMQAWKNLSNEKTIRVPLRNAQGEQYLADVNIEVAAFNFGVNELALKANVGWRQADRFNIDAFKILFGDNLAETSAPQGWVGRYLSDNPTAPNAHKVRVLSQQLKAIWAEKSHHHDGGEPYKAALRVSLLAYEIGAVPCWNCKSGKDRTSMLDAELKREVVKMHQQSRALMPQQHIVSTPGASLEKNEQHLLQTILRYGGNKEIQEYNTGAPGNKVIRQLPWPINLSTCERIGDQQVYIETKGLSGLV